MTLRTGDLRDLVDSVVEIDSYKSKMGSDNDIIVVALSTLTSEAATDLSNFVERGYSSVLDADATPGEQSDGRYRVFIEIERGKDSSENIMEIIDGIQNLTSNDKMRFRYYKNFKSKDLTSEILEEVLPITADDYDVAIQEGRMQNYKNFFDKSFVEDVTMHNDTLIIKKAYADPVAFKYIDFGPTQETLDSINESFNPNDFAEIIFLSKYIGDYNITKYGSKLTFTNNNDTLVLERIIL
jgi:hypothetical protein